MKKYSSNRAQKGKTAYRTPSRFKAQVRGAKDGFAMGKNFEQRKDVGRRFGNQ